MHECAHRRAEAKEMTALLMGQELGSIHWQAAWGLRRQSLSEATCQARVAWGVKLRSRIQRPFPWDLAPSCPWHHFMALSLACLPKGSWQLRLQAASAAGALQLRENIWMLFMAVLKGNFPHSVGTSGQQVLKSAVQSSPIPDSPWIRTCVWNAAFGRPSDVWTTGNVVEMIEI